MTDSTFQDFQTILQAIDVNKNSPHELSALSLKLASLRATVGEVEADAEAEYAQEVIKALQPGDDGKKISVAEAERIADVVLEARRERLTNRLESIDQAQNAIARRLRVLGVEEAQAGGAI